MYIHDLSPPIFQSSCTVLLLLYLAQRSIMAVLLRIQLNKKGQPKKVWTMKIWYAFISFGSAYQGSFYFPPIKSLSKLSAHGYICIHTPLLQVGRFSLYVYSVLQNECWKICFPVRRNWACQLHCSVLCSIQDYYEGINYIFQSICQLISVLTPPPSIPDHRNTFILSSKL